MSRRFFFLTISYLLLAHANANAQNYALEVTTSKEVIYIKELGYPENLSVSDLLVMYPSILNRNTEGVIDGYEIQVDDKTIGTAKDVILIQTKLREVEKIEISSSPSATQQKNGQGGVINLILKTPDKDGLSGAASLFFFTSVDMMPALNLDYRKGGLVIRSKLNMEFFNAYRDYEIKESAGLNQTFSSKSVKDKFWQESAKMDLVYTSPKGNNVFKFWLNESYDKDKISTHLKKHQIYDKSAEIGEGWTYNEYSETEDRLDSKYFGLTLATEYKHLLGKNHTITLSCDFDYSKVSDYKNEDMKQTIYPKNVMAKFEYKRPWMSGDYSLITESGCNYTGSNDKVYAQKHSSQYFSPYLNLKYKHSKWAMDAGARFQHYRYLNSRNDWTFNLNVLWQMYEHHALRFIGLKNIVRPSESMLNPMLSRNQLDNSWVIGNPYLLSSSIYTASVKYIHDWKRGLSNFLFSASLGYHYTNDGIESIIVRSEYGLIPYTTYDNTNLKKTVFADFSLLYSYDFFSCAFTGNYFISRSYGFDDSKDKYRYFNLMLYPVVRFRQQWALSSRMLYNSRIKNMYSTKGDCFLMSINLTKSFGKWSLFAEMSDIFGYKTWDYDYANHTETGYNLYKRYIGLGLTYKF